MAFSGRQRSSNLFIISEGQFYSKPSLKLERLERDYTALKTKESEDQIELRRLRTENHLLRQRNENLEKESSVLADKLVHEQVTWAREVDKLYALRSELSLKQHQLHELQKKLSDTEVIIGDFRKKNNICTNQIRRMGEDMCALEKKLEESIAHEKFLQIKIKNLIRKLDDTETRMAEEAILARIKDAENIQQLVELRCKIAEIDIQKEELLAAGKLCDKGENQELENSVLDIKDEFPVPGQSKPGGHLFRKGSQWGNNSDDEEFDALIKESENFCHILSDIIEGRHNSSSHFGRCDAKENALFAFKNIQSESKITSTEDSTVLSEFLQIDRCSMTESGNYEYTDDKNSFQEVAIYTEKKETPYDSVVYEPLYGISSLTYNYCYSDKVDFVLKESTV